MDGFLSEQGHHDRGLAARDGDARASSQLRPHAADDLTHQAHVAEDDARLYGVHGVAADRDRRRRKGDRRELGGISGKRFDGRGEAGRNGHAAQLSRGRDRGKAERRAEIHDDAVLLESVERRDRIGHEVRADLGRILRGDPKPDVHCGCEQKRNPVRKLDHRFYHSTGERRHDAGKDRRIDAARRELRRLEKGAEDHEVLVGGLGVHRLDAPPAFPRAVLMGPKSDVRIADRHGQEHGDPPFARESAPSLASRHGLSRTPSDADMPWCDTIFLSAPCLLTILVSGCCRSGVRSGKSPSSLSKARRRWSTTPFSFSRPLPGRSSPRTVSHSGSMTSMRSIGSSPSSTCWTSLTRSTSQ